MLVNHKIILLLSFLTASVFACTPNNFNGNYIAISLTGTSTKDWRANLGGGLANAGVQLIIYNSGDQPDNNEIFTIAQPTPGNFEIFAYIDFNQKFVIGQTQNSNTFTLQNRTDSNAQQFTFDCGTCNIKTNSQNWTLYHTSCSIKNVDNGLCMDAADYYSSASINQTYCTAASKWDLWGISPKNVNVNSSSNPNITVTTSPTITVTTSPNSASEVGQSSGVQLSIGGLVGIIVGSCAGTAIIAILGVLFFRHRQSNVGKTDRVNLQIVE
ncbi:9136_t:CDS:2 [Ambispora leptoticha]|uniref:9136_t:CDS:1 n=1 Tax=Ambispora leptoticha TaxID=144679 RepID=A0A9N8ZZN9_9GLOM|nr:9136_t:CDS:2 [Ambispora leptoticha]